MRPGLEPASSWILVRFLTAELQWELSPLYLEAASWGLEVGGGVAWRGQEPCRVTAQATALKVAIHVFSVEWLWGKRTLLLL